MFDLNLLSPEVVGVLASFIAGLIALIPAMGATDSRRAVVAIITLVVAVFWQQGFVVASWQEFGHTLLTAAVYAVVSYKMLLQPLVLPGVAKALTAAGIGAKAQG